MDFMMKHAQQVFKKIHETHRSWLAVSCAQEALGIPLGHIGQAPSIYT